MNLFTWFGIAILSFTGPGISRVRVGEPFSPPPYFSAKDIFFTNGLKIDTRQPSADRGEPSTYWLIHFSEPIRHKWLSLLKERGFEPVCYIAYQTVVVRRNKAIHVNLSQLPQIKIDWLGPYLPEYKLAPELLKSQKAKELAVALWSGEVRVVSGVRDLKSIIEDEDVAWVERAEQFKPFNRDVQWVMQIGWRPMVPDPIEGRRVWRYGIRGQGMVVGLFDTGINTAHYMFYDPLVPIENPGLYPNHRKIIAYKLYRDAAFGDARLAEYHGSAVAGTLAGNDEIMGDSSDLDGIAPDARIYFLDIARANGQYVVSEDLSEALDSVRLGRGLSEPVYQVSGSFGSGGFLSYYRLPEASVDAVCWEDKQFLVVWAAGNEGGSKYRLGHPAGAKNCLTVGGCGNGTKSNTIYLSSSPGPTRDERIKPNVVAPAENIWTVNGEGVNTYWVREGTSFSAPAVSGALTLLRQYFKEGWFPTGEPNPNHRIEKVSSALMRALAICAADTSVGDEVVPNEKVGWGRLNLSNIMHLPDDSIAFTFVDETIGLETGRYDEYEFILDRREPLTVVLAWTDTAAAPLAQIALVNDLNLELESPDGNRYRGNQFYRGRSVPNPATWDERNVEEVVKIALPLNGRWKIRVYARNIYTQRQPYALVVKGGIKGLPPGIEEKYRVSKGNFTKEDAFSTIIHSAQSLFLPANAALQIYTIDGRLIAQFATSQEQKVNWRPVRAGVYFYRLKLANNKTLTGKLTVVK
ncbi:MAG: S8 family serine peptidase [candidate division WOR-3 bacterium]